MDKDLIVEILNADISRDVKEKIVSYWLLPRTEGVTTPLQTAVKEQGDDGRVGAVKRPSKKDLDLRKDPKAKETEDAMTETIEAVLKDDKSKK